MTMNAESLMHERGSVAVVAHKDLFSREEKDALRDSDLVRMEGGSYVLLIDEEIEENDALALASHEEFEDDQRKAADDDSDEPTMDDLKALTVDGLKALAEKDQVDLSGLKLKDDILGRLAAHFGLDPAS